LSGSGLSARWIPSDRPEAGEHIAAAVDGQPDLGGQVDVDDAGEQPQDGAGRAVQDQVGVDGPPDPGVDLPSADLDDGLLA
jgi:hypothetical protein